MNQRIEFVHYTGNKKSHCSVKQFGIENAKTVNAFHKSFPEYSVTPLVSLDNLSEAFGVNKIYIKDESYRFGLNAFKVLGGSYCIGKYIADKLGMDMEDLSYRKITGSEIKNKMGDITFVTATDGNHGRGIAWAANRLGYKSVVYMPKGSSIERLNNIKAHGADAFITDCNYDDTVRIAKANAEKNGWILMQDTAWEGYTSIPSWIMEGYTTIAYEIIQQLEDEKPTHIFLQAGVGALAGAMTGFFADYYAEHRPIITIVEPNKADCFYKTAKAKDGSFHIVTDDMDTIMAGLACGEPCTIAWDVLNEYADFFVSAPDYVAAKGMRILGNPLAEDKKVVSGESGAVTLGFVAEIIQNQSLGYLREQLQINKDSKILCISTEGDTDKENYRRIVWDGLHPSY